MRRLSAFICVYLWLISGLSQAAAVAPSPREFVQSFYTWYAPMAMHQKGRAWDVAVKEKSTAFSADLIRALKADSLAQDKSTGDIVGLDFDPFFYSQDAAQHYEVNKVTANGTGWLVEVVSVRAGKKNEKESVVAELSPANGGWQFVNFHYEENQNLMSILKTLRDEREKPSR